MKKNKAILLVLGFALSTLIGTQVFAGQFEDECRESTGYVNGMQDTVANHSVVATYQACVSEKYRMQQEQQNAPPAPGNPPVYNCEQYNNGLMQIQFEKCKADYELAKADYDGRVEAYNQYHTAHPNMNVAATPSATQLLEDVASKQQKAIDRQENLSAILTTTGGIMMAIGLVLVATVYGVTAGWILIGIGAAMILYNLIFVRPEIKRLINDKSTTCEKYNKIATKPIDCPNAQSMTTVDGIIPIANNSSATGNVPEFIDTTTGTCKGNAPAECPTIVNAAPKGCFKKGGACLAGGKGPLPQVIAKNGKISVNINGKNRTFGVEDFQSEAAMVKAGFSPKQAKQFISDINNPNGIFARSGINAKGEIKDLSKIPSTAPSIGGSSAGAGAGKAGESMTMKKDEYQAVEVKEVASAPASSEGATKDLDGNIIGSDSDDLFKMMNRRYMLKQHQNIFLEQ